MFVNRNSAVILVCLSFGLVLGENDLDNEVCLSKGDTCLSVQDDAEMPGNAKYDIHVFSIAPKLTDGYQRFQRSAEVNKIPVKTLGLKANWNGDNTLFTGGGYKLNFLKRALKELKSGEDSMVLYTDSNDVIYTRPLDEIVEKFRETGARVLFAAKHFCDDDETLQHLFPKVTNGSQYLNAGMFIGYFPEIKELLDGSILNTANEHVFMSHLYLDEKLRIKLKLQLDHRSIVFQSLYGAMANVKLDTHKDEYLLLNTAHETIPAVVQGNGPSQVFLNNYGSYIAGAFVDQSCIPCKENAIKLPEDSELPTITLAAFILRATPFLGHFLQSIDALDYPKCKLHVFIHNAVEVYDEEISQFLETKGFASVRQTDRAGKKVDEAMARNMAVSHASSANTDYLFVVDSTARLDNSSTLRELLSQNRTFIAPILTRHNEAWSNFWGALSESGFYARSHDYIAIVQDTIRGIWNVPYVSSSYLANKSIFPLMEFYDVDLEPDMTLCQNLRKEGIFMYLSNEVHFGHLANEESYNLLQTRPDFYTMLSNPLDWEQQYLHADYPAQLDANFTHKQPCPDVFWFPIVTEKFAADLIEIMEGYGKWSDGSESDDRLKGGYEAVPTRDIHMGQVGLEELWLKFLQRYVRPLQELAYKGYFHNPPEALMNFVVRYRPTEQPFLKPHHDTSTYTINIALNRAGIDYEGGGCRFVRYNCSVTDTKVGHMLMHPGRLTHYHEGLYVTKGTRYIMVSFVDP